MNKAIAEGKKEKKILITLDNDLSIETSGIDSGLDAIGILRLAEVEMIEALTGHLFRTSEVKEN